MAMCTEFDGIAGTRSVAQNDYVAASDVTLLAYAVSKAGHNHQTLPLAMYSRGSSTDKKTPARLQLAKRYGIGMFVYNAGHVWYVKRVSEHEWKQLDSLSGVRDASLESFWRDGLGVEVVFPVEGDPFPGYTTPSLETPQLPAVVQLARRPVRVARQPVPPPAAFLQQQQRQSRMSLGFMSR